MQLMHYKTFSSLVFDFAIQVKEDISDKFLKLNICLIKIVTLGSLIGFCAFFF